MKATKLLLLLFVFLFFLVSVSSVFATTYPYWIEHNESGNAINYVWTKVNLTANGNTTLYINKTAGYSPNGDAVFDFFDDFNGNSLDTSKWDTQYIGGGSYSVSNSQLNLSYSGSGNNTVLSTKNLVNTQNTITEARTNIVSINGQAFGVNYRGNFSTDNTSRIFFLASSDSTQDDIYIDANGNGSYDYSTNFTSWSTGINAFETDITSNSVEEIHSSQTATYSGTLSNFNLYLYLGFYTAGVSATDKTFDVDIDYVFVRKYASTEPTVTVTDKGSYYEVQIHNNEATALTDYQVGIPVSSLGVTNASESLYITNQAPVFGNQSVYPTPFYVGTNVTQQFDLVNNTNNQTIYLSATDENTSTLLYNESFIVYSNQSNATFRHSIVIPVTIAHHTINFTTSSSVAGILDSQTYAVSNTPPTAPTDIALNTPLYVNSTIIANASGSIDVDEDNLSYYYLFKDESGTILQNWSTTDNYTIPVSEAHQKIIVEAKAYDGYDYGAIKSASFYVSDTAPTITGLTNQQKYNSKGGTVCYNWSSFDLDNDAVSYNFTLYGFGYWIKENPNDTSQVVDTQSGMTYSFTPNSVYSDYSGIPVWKLYQANAIVNNLICVDLPTQIGYENNDKNGKYFDGFVFPVVSVTDVQNVVGDGDKSTTLKGFSNVTAYNTTEYGPSFGDNYTAFLNSQPYLTYLYTANLTYCLIDEYNWSNWDLNQSEVDVEGHDIFRGGAADSDKFIQSSGSGCSLGTPVNRVYKYFMTPSRKYLMNFYPQGDSYSNYAGSRSLFPTDITYHGHIPVVLLYPSDASHIISPTIQYTDGTAPSVFEVYTYYNGIKYIISEGLTNTESTSSFPQFPMIFSDLYYFILDGYDYGILSVTSSPLIFKIHEGTAIIPPVSSIPTILVSPNVVSVGKNETLNITFIDTPNEYPYWGYTLKYPNGSVVLDYTNHSDFYLSRNFTINTSRYGVNVELNIYGFKSEPTITYTVDNATNITSYKFIGGDGRIIATKKIGVLNYDIMSLSSVLKKLNNIGNVNITLVLLMWFGLVIAMWLAAATMNLGIGAQVLITLIPTLLFFPVMPLALSTSLFVMQIILFIVIMMMG